MIDRIVPLFDYRAPSPSANEIVMICPSRLRISQNLHSENKNRPSKRLIDNTYIIHTNTHDEDDDGDDEKTMIAMTMTYENNNNN